jgi:hypothetical protein
LQATASTCFLFERLHKVTHLPPKSKRPHPLGMKPITERLQGDNLCF